MTSRNLKNDMYFLFGKKRSNWILQWNQNLLIANPNL